MALHLSNPDKGTLPAIVNEKTSHLRVWGVNQMAANSHGLQSIVSIQTDVEIVLFIFRAEFFSSESVLTELRPFCTEQDCG